MIIFKHERIYYTRALFEELVKDCEYIKKPVMKGDGDNFKIRAKTTAGDEIIISYFHHNEGYFYETSWDNKKSFGFLEPFEPIERAVASAVEHYEGGGELKIKSVLYTLRTRQEKAESNALESMKKAIF